jgi:cytochrome c oxidase subunit 2
MMSWLPANISTFGGDIDRVFATIYYVVGAWFVAAELLLLWFVLRYRRRPGVRAAYVRGEKWSQLAWVLVPAAVVFGLDLWLDGLGAPVWAKIKEHAPPGGVEVGVVGKQFNWAFKYPGADGQLGTGDDFALDNELHVPANENVHFTLTSEDVLHSFFIPTVRIKQDVVPGRAIKGWFNATVPGKYELPCAELCGFGHYTMRGFLYVHTPDEYQRWVADRIARAAK